MVIIPLVYSLLLIFNLIISSMFQLLAQAGGDYSFLIMLFILGLPFFLVCWLLIEVIRWLRRK